MDTLLRFVSAVLLLSIVVNSAPITTEAEITSRKLNTKLGTLICNLTVSKYECSSVHTRLERGRFNRCRTAKVPISGLEVRCKLLLFCSFVPCIFNLYCCMLRTP